MPLSMLASITVFEEVPLAALSFPPVLGECPLASLTTVDLVLTKFSSVKEWLKNQGKTASEWLAATGFGVRKRKRAWKIRQG